MKGWSHIKRYIIDQRSGRDGNCSDEVTQRSLTEKLDLFRVGGIDCIEKSTEMAETQSINNRKTRRA